MSAAPVLSITNASVVYPDGTSTVTALDSANVEIFPGELVAIVGESGSGKSTLLSIAGFLQEPTSGTVTLHGAEGLDATSTRREHIGFVFQQPNLLGSLTAREQLLITDHLRGIKPRKDRADELLARVGLKGLGGRRVAQLSGGQRQRVNIARALMGNPPTPACRRTHLRPRRSTLQGNRRTTPRRHQRICPRNSHGHPRPLPTGLRRPLRRNGRRKSPPTRITLRPIFPVQGGRKQQTPVGNSSLWLLSTGGY
ncbi:Vitamin B12 import ATP-binding protein BtuD [Corynebacterium diphtheriae]|nr:Vitamin B12 import ATP-binding protein BtuD [Corynebacterium diphtheriae]